MGKKYLEKGFRGIARGPNEHHSIPNIQLSFKIAVQQEISEGGLLFTVVLSNTSSEDAKIENPLDYLQIILQDEEGWPVKLPLATPARALFNASGPIEITRSFKVESIENSLSEANLMTIAKDEDILLKAGTAYQFNIRIDKVMDTDKKSVMAVVNTAKPIDKGKYKVNINLSILLSDDKTVYRQNESGYVEVELI